MEFVNYLRMLRSRWIYVVIPLLAGLLGGLILSMASATRFESVSHLFLATPGWGTPTVMGNAESSPYRGSEFSQLRAVSYLRVAESEDFRLRVENRIGTAPADIPDTDSIAFRIVPDTVLIELTAMATSPARALDLSNALTAEMTESIESLETPSGTLVPVVQPMVVDTGHLSDEPAEPQTSFLVIAGGVLGFLVGVTVAVVISRVSRRVHGALELATISSLPVLATFSAGDLSPSNGADSTTSDGATRAVESAASRLRFNLEFLGPSFSQGLLVVSSPLAADGATTTVARGLVCATAETGRRALYVDCEIRGNRSRGTRGLTDVLRGSAALDDVITEPVSGRGYVLPTGEVPDVVSGMLESRVLQSVLQDLRDRFDLVVLDVPGFINWNDAATLGSRSDAVLVVVSDGVSRIDDLTTTFDGFTTVGARVVGSVLCSHRPDEVQFDFVAAPDPFRQSKSAVSFVDSAPNIASTTRGATA